MPWKIACVVAFSASLFAQSIQYTSKVSVPDDLVARQALSEAEDALKRGDLERAHQRWQSVLDRFSNKVTQSFAAPRGVDDTDEILPGDRFRGLQATVLARIQSAGLEAYRKLYEEEAMRAFERAFERMDESLLREVMTRFLLTESGPRAGLALIDLALEQGRDAEALAAAESLHRRLEDCGAKEATLIAVLAREAQALSSCGKRERLQALLGRIPAGARVQIGEETLEFQAFIGRLLADLPETETKPVLRPALKTFEREGWALPLARNTNETDGTIVSFGIQRRLSGDNDQIYAAVPIIRDGVVYCCDGLNVHARALTTGEPLWPPVRADVAEFSGRQNPNLQHQVVLDGDLLFAALEDQPLQREQMSWQGFRPVEALPSRKLIAIDATTGEVRWNHANFGALDIATQLFLRRFHVNQPPLIVGDALIVAGTYPEGIFHQWVVAFDKHTGQLRWRTYLGSGQQELNMFGRPIKEAIPSPVVLDQGQLFVSTNIGTVASLDATTGEILWISAYEQEPIPTTERLDTRERAPGYLPAPPAVYGDKVFFAPSDAYALWMADRHTGALVPVEASMRSRTQPWRYFLGLHKDQLLIAGATVQAIDAQSLRPRWRSIDMSAGGRSSDGQVLGLPVVIGDSLIFTTRTAAQRETSLCFRVDLNSGRIVEDQVMGGIFREGNLAAAGDGFALATANRLYAFADLVELKRRLERLTAGAAAAPDLLMRLGELEAHGGALGRALQSFERALAGATEQGPRGFGLARRARLALFNGWLRAAKDAETHRAPNLPTDPERRFEKALEYARSDAQKVEALYGSFQLALAEDREALLLQRADELLAFGDAVWIELGPDLTRLSQDLARQVRAPAGVAALLSLGQRAEAANRPADAVRIWHRLQTEHANVPLGRLLGASFAGERIAQLIKAHGRQIYASLDAQAAKDLAAARAAEDLDALRAIVERYPESKVLGEATIELAALLARRNLPGLAHFELQRLLARQEKPTTELFLQAAEHALAAGYPESARELLRFAESRALNPRTRVDWSPDKVKTTIASLTERKPELAEKAASSRPLGRALKPGPALGDLAPGDRAQLLKPAGIRPEGVRQIVVLHNGMELRGADPLSGQTLWAKSALSVPSALQWRDGLLLAGLDDALVAFDPESGAERWRFQEAGSLRAMVGCMGRLWLAYSVVRARPITVFVAIDAVTGREVFRTAISTRGDYAGLSATESLVLLNLQGEAHVFDAASGQGYEKFAIDRQAPAATLTKNGLVVLVQGPGAIGSIARPLLISARDAVTGEERWRFDEVPPGISRVLTSTESTLALTHQDGRNPAQLLVFDLDAGKVRYQRRLDQRSIPLAAERDGDLLYVTMRSRVGSGDRSAQRIEAVDLRAGQVLWATSEFGEAALEIAPTKDWLLVLKHPSGLGEIGAATAQGEIYFIDQKTGRAEELLGLGPMDTWTTSGSLLTFDQGFAASTGSAIRTFIPRE